MELVGQRLKFLREKAHLTQAKMAELLEAKQPAINRYEHGQAAAPFKILRAYADYFDVSLDYIFGRCDEPQGKLYEYKPNYSDSPEMRKFVEMCFDPGSAMNEKLKQAEYSFSEGEKKYSALFSSFFHTIAIKERKNYGLQRNMLPLRYREYMTEFQGK